MNADDLKQTNVGRDVLIESLNGFNDARATLRSWSSDKTVAIVKLSSTYGRVPKMVKCGYCDDGRDPRTDRDCPVCLGAGKRKRNSGRGKLLTEGTLTEIPIGTVRFAPGQKPGHGGRKTS